MKITAKLSRKALIGVVLPLNESTAVLGADSVVVGAAELAFAGLIDDPLGHLARSGATRLG